MFGRKLKNVEEAPVLPRLSITGVYGKLASEADFIQLDSNWREVKQLDEILQNVYLDLSRTNDQGQFKSCGILMTGGGDRQTLLALAYPSEDRAGRIYPFVVFNRLSDINFSLKPDAQLMACLEALKSVSGENLRLSQKPNSTWIDQVKALPEYQTVMDIRLAKREAMKQCEQLTLADLLLELAGADDVMQKKTMTGIALLLRQLKNGRIHRAYNGIWLPLLRDEHHGNSLTFWLQLLTAVMTNQNWRPDIVWTADQSNTRLYILSKPLTHSALKATTDGPASVNSYFGWHDALGDDSEAAKIQPQVEQWLQRKDTNLLDIAIEWYQLL